MYRSMQERGLGMADVDEMQDVLFNLLAQVQRNLTAEQADQVERLIQDGSHRAAVEQMCTLANAGRHPLPMHARAMAFRLADRLGMLPADLGLLN
jgi:hypothetical protein